MGCKHAWEIIIDKIVKSSLLRPTSFKLNDMQGGSIEDLFDPFKDTAIIILQCTKCGKLNKTIEKV